MPKEMTLDQSAERVRKAVIRRGCSVTVGDIISETGLGAAEAKEALDRLIGTHEGVLRVNDRGELMYVFRQGCIRRDYRSWWSRHRDGIMRILKKFFKIVIFLVLVFYFILYLLIIILFLLSGRNNNSRSSNLSDLTFIIYLFWGGPSYDSRRPARDGKKRQPIYTRVYNYVFGPEEAPADPHAAKAECAQLIRARRGVITLEDWLCVSGQSREKCESDLARYTAEFEGTAEITEAGTLVYIFEDMMTTGSRKNDSMPAMCWRKPEKPLPLSGNVDGGDAMVVGLNVFNMCMSGVITYAMFAATQPGAETAGFAKSMSALITGEYGSYAWWIGLFPFIFSTLIFAGPLVRLPGNIKENRIRRETAIRKALLEVLFSRNNPRRRLSFNQVLPQIMCYLNSCSFTFSESKIADEAQKAYNAFCYDFRGEMTDSDDVEYEFKEFVDSEREAMKIRDKTHFENKSFGKSVFSTDNAEQERVEDEEARKALSDFDRALSGKQARAEDAVIEAPQVSSALHDWGNSMNGSDAGRGSYDNGYGSQNGAGQDRTHRSER